MIELVVICLLLLASSAYLHKRVRAQRRQRKWDKRFLQLASMISTWSKDPSSQVGAIIANKHNRMVSSGFNGFPVGTDDSVVSRDEKLCRTIHAETNAILFAKESLEGCTLYTTHPPCSSCTAKIIQVGIKRIVSSRPPIDFESRWNKDLLIAKKMLSEAKVIHEVL